MDNLIDVREINKLIKEEFIIPAYQRGYRWDEKQVTELLDDLWEFINKEKKKGEFYCLQPIVLVRRNGKCELIDGQQRLTTIFIILKYLEKVSYSIEFKTRKQSKDFLDNIKDYQDEEVENIDFYFIRNAYNCVKLWFELKIRETEEYTIQDEFSVELGKNTKVIWYEVNTEADVVSIFTRLNIGKIQLTNAELIKALFLCSDNFAKNVNDDMVKTDIIRLKQLEIANEWDQIEMALQNDKFWYFINKQQNDMPTRIEFIFNALSQKGIGNKYDEFFTFRYFNDRLRLAEDMKLWDDVKNYFMILQEWYNNIELYHLIGYLVSCGDTITSLMKRYNECKSKLEFKKYIINRIREILSKIKVEELQYGDDNKDIINLLLLFNIQTIIKSQSVDVRFPFDSYVKSSWSIEHIHAQNAEGLNTKEQWKTWIIEHINSFKNIDEDKYIDVIEKLQDIDYDKLTKDEFNELFEYVKEKIKDDYGIDLHSIDNLALLDKDTNSALNNQFFDVKRKIIIQRDRDGYFIPMCTRNVFLKYYSQNPMHICYWNEEDRKNYLEKIEEILEVYLPEREKVTNEQ